MDEEEEAPKKGWKLPRWAMILLAVAIVAVLIAGISAIYTSTRKDQVAAPTPPPPIAAGGADGCIAGNINDAPSLLDGAHQQPHTSQGAAATAAGFLRFTAQYPSPSEQQLTTVISGMYDLAPGEDAQALAKDALSTSAPKNAQTAGFSVADGRYVIEPASTQDEVQVSIASQVIIDGKERGVSATTFTMAWSDGIWKFVDSQEITDEQRILDNGVAFVGGC
uniref:hypothetical protein n=1 Tax=Arthrobacter sp. TaxID=1667 RepID=UPI000EB62A64|nr:hypothetical protein [Arthrobacter sp.]AXV46685.1 hypothetical protein pA58H3_p71 [Arthrobacter sp.]